MTTNAAANRFGMNIIDVRRILGMQQQELAKRLNVTPGAISHIESGRRMPSFSTMLKIKRALRVEWSALLRGID